MRTLQFPCLLESVQAIWLQFSILLAPLSYLYYLDKRYLLSGKLNGVFGKEPISLWHTTNCSLKQEVSH